MADLRLGENIRSLRKEKGIGQEVLAGQLGVTVQAVSKWETGGSMPDITLLPQLAEYFEVTMEELFYGRKEKASEDQELPEDAIVLAPETENANEQAAQGKENSPSEEQLLTLENEFEGLEDEFKQAEAEFPKDAPEQPRTADMGQEWEKMHPNEDPSSESDAGWERAWDTEGKRSRPYGWNDLENLGRTISDSISEQVKRIKEGVKGSSNFELHFGDDRWAKENQVREDLPADQVLRVVQFIGNRIVSVDEVRDDQPVRLFTDSKRARMDVRIFGSASITGGIGGSVSAEGNVKCGSVGGNVTSDGNVECQSVGGTVTADGNVTCGNVGGRVSSDGDVNCGAVMGSVSADGDVHCGHVTGPVRCDGNVYQTK